MYTIEKVSTLASKSVPLSLVLEATLLYSWLFCAGGNLGVDSDHRLQKIVHDLLQVSYYISENDVRLFIPWVPSSRRSA
jgi:hypothetical protein